MGNKYNELIRLIELKKEELSNEEPKPQNPKLEYLTYFFEKYKIFGRELETDINAYEILLTYLLEQYKEQNFDDLKKQVDENENFLKYMSYEDLYCIAYISINIDIEKIENLVSILDRTPKLLKKFICWRLKNALAKKVKIKLEGFKDLESIKMFFRTSILARKAINYQSIKNLNTLFESIKNENPINISLLASTFEKSYEYYQSLKKEEIKREKIKKQRIANYSKIISTIERMKERQEIVEIDAVLKLIDEDDLKIAYLKYVNEHNQKYYQELEKEYHSKNTESISNYISYFHSLQLSFLELPEELKQAILNIEIEELKNRISILVQLPISINDVILISTKSNLTIIKEIDSYLKDGYIDTNSLLNNLSIFYDTNLLENFRRNIEMVLNKKISLISVINKCFLFADNQVLKQNLDILKSLQLSINQIKDFSMLSDTNLIEKLASLIEVGLEKEIKTNPEILNADINLAKRIVIARMVGEEIFDENGIKASILEKDNFFVPDYKIDQYLLDRDNSSYHCRSQVIFEESIINSSKNTWSYNIDGIMIPKLRVNNLSISLEQIIAPSLYNKEEVKKLEKQLKVEN